MLEKKNVIYSLLKRPVLNMGFIHLIEPDNQMDNSSFYKLQPQLHSGDLQTFQHQVVSAPRRSALDLSAPRRFGTKLVNSPRRFWHQGVSAPDGWMDGWADGRTDLL